MNILLIEDELPAARLLAKLLAEHCPQGRIMATLDSVEAASQWLQKPPTEPDLIFMDIQLADGLSFDIFNQTEVRSPVIFTTAFDQYMLKAFKVHSIDYLLKPVEPEELVRALEKYERFFKKQETFDFGSIQQLLQAAVQRPQYKERFLVKSGQHLIHLPIADIAYFFSEDKVAFAKGNDGRKHIIEYTLDQLEGCLDPRQFFRINRQTLVRPEAIGKISQWFNSRLKVELLPPANDAEVVSRERVAEFKKWLNGEG
ncbi:MAG: response regulator transcription factor [Saprospiraceae bacterium]|nr:response regulator transcription factor [Saprospiraceae bacterium]